MPFYLSEDDSCVWTILTQNCQSYRVVLAEDFFFFFFFPGRDQYYRRLFLWVCCSGSTRRLNRKEVFFRRSPGSNLLAEDLETKLLHAPNSISLLSGYEEINWIFIYLSFCFSIRCRMNRHNFHILINKCEYIFCIII